MWTGKLRRVGFWRSDSEPFLPDPHTMVDPAWNAMERRRVIAYLRSGRHAAAYKGWSTCRFCKQPNGSTELTDNMWLWPEGLAHYLEVHQVKLPEDFLTHVRMHGYQVPPLSKVDPAEALQYMFGSGLWKR